MIARFHFSQIVQEELLEDINNILNSGEVPNLFEKDDLEQVLAAVRPMAKEAGIAEGNRDGIFQHFIARYQSIFTSLGRILDFLEKTCWWYRHCLSRHFPKFLKLDALYVPAVNQTCLEGSVDPDT